MKRIEKEYRENEVKYTYEVSSKAEAYRIVTNHAKIFKNSIGACGGYDIQKKINYVSVFYAR